MENYFKKTISQLNEIISEIKGINNEIKKVDKDLKDWELKKDEMIECETDDIIGDRIKGEEVEDE